MAINKLFLTVLTATTILLHPVLGHPRPQHLQRRAQAPFHLKTSPGDLYLQSYHTGAGLSDAVLTTDKSTASTFVLKDDTSLQTEDTTGQGFTWGLTMDPANNYAGWEFVRINAGTSTPGFSIDDDDEVSWDRDPQFDGWLVCDWWHNAPQLFWIVKSRADQGFPSTCQRVSLVTEEA